MESLVLLLKMIVCLVGGVAVGRWFLAEARQRHAHRESLFKAYLSPPGLIILAVLIVLPIILWLTRSS